MKKYLIVYKDDWYDIQKVEGYWDLYFEYEPLMIIELTKEILEKIEESK